MTDPIRDDPQVVRASRRSGIGVDGNGADPLWLVLAIAFPAVLINVGHGHNGFLTAALLGGGLVSLDRRPLVAGILFGLMAYKPQFGLMIPVALIAGGHGRAFSAAAATVISLVGVTLLAFGPHAWQAFIASSNFARVVLLEMGEGGLPRIQSVFAWTLMWGGAIPLAYAVQGAVAFAVAWSLIRIWRSDGNGKQSSCGKGHPGHDADAQSG